MKASILTIKFEPNWILNNQVSGKSSVIDDVVKKIKERYQSESVFVINKEFHQCKIIVACNQTLVENEINVFIKSDVSSVQDDTNVGIAIEEIDVEKLKETLITAHASLDKENIDFLKREFDLDLKETEDKIEPESRPESTCSVDDLIGLEPLKKWIKETETIASKYKEIAISSKILNNSVYLMSINRGNGLTTVLELMSQTLKKTELVGFAGKRDYIEWNLGYNDNPNDFSSFEGLLHILNKCELGGKFKGIISLNIEEWIDHLTDKKFEKILDFMWNNKDDMLFVFTIPYVEDDILEKVAGRIDDIISVRTMKFVPPSDEQYFTYFAELFKKYEVELEEGAFSAFIAKITSEKNDGRFYGFNTVKKIANEMLYKLIVKAAKNETEIPNKIGVSDFVEMYGIGDNQLVSGIEQLNGMVALKEVKSKVQEILSTVKLQKELYSNGSAAIKPCFHMMFTGNPGTGKTVVARIIGRIFKEEGLLTVGNFYEVSRKDFIGKFVGHTAPKTMEICRNALGSVLFIDEAYMLADDRDGYSAEAIGTLIAEMENNRDKMVVIFAGYEKELENLFDMNPGLRDRIPYKINFPNYNREELKRIFYIQLKNKMRYDNLFERQANKFFDEFPEDVMETRDFSNGRFVRNLAERIISKAALRFEISGADISSFELTNSDFDVAISDNDFKKLFSKVKKTSKIGF